MRFQFKLKFNANIKQRFSTNHYQLNSGLSWMKPISFFSLGSLTKLIPINIVFVYNRNYKCIKRNPKKVNVCGNDTMARSIDVLGVSFYLLYTYIFLWLPLSMYLDYDVQWRVVSSVNKKWLHITLCHIQWRSICILGHAYNSCQ